MTFFTIFTAGFIDLSGRRGSAALTTLGFRLCPITTKETSQKNP
jgi:hypothetical protein